MQRKSFAGMTCPIARTLERVGEWWTLLILRDAFAGIVRFDAFQESLGIAPNMLSRRLATLVDAGMLEKRPYSTRPPRYEYVLTDRGRDFRTVLIGLLAFGHKHFSEDRESTRIVNAATGQTADPVFVDRLTGVPLASPLYTVVRGKRQTRASASVNVTRKSSLLDMPSVDAQPAMSSL